MTKKSERAPKGRAAKVADQTDKQPGPVKPLARRRGRETVDEGKQEGLERATRRRKAAHNPSNTDSTEAGILAADDELLHSPDKALSDARDLLDEGLGQKAERFMDAVVKVFCVHSDPNFSLPWQRKRQYSSSSSGFIISGRRILTNAHSVAHHTQVKVRRRGSEAKFIAKVLAQGPECDIALLTVEDESFWDSKINPVQFGQLPQLQDAVAVVGFPIGGDTMSVTSGVVSRIEVTSYSHGATALLGMQIDAAINAGNSGGPAFNAKGECVGIAFQSLKTEDAENIGYVIPIDVVQHFITDFERNNRFTSFPILGVDWQKMESPYLRAALGMKTEQKGVLIKAIEPTSNAASHLKKGDILLSFDGTVIANDGTVPFRSGERIGFSYLVSRKFTGDKGEVEVLRAGKVRQMELTLSVYNRLIPEHLSNRPPTYYIIAGFVFTQVSTPYLKSEYGKEYEWEAPVKLLDQLLHGKSRRPDQQVVVLGHVLAADCTVGYEELQNCEVNKVNGKAVNNLRDLVEVVDACKQQYLKFELQYDVTVIIETAIARAATKDIMAMHNISDDRSIDLRALQ